MEESPVEETPMEEASVEESPVEETPMEESPVEETPIEESPVEESPVEEVSSTIPVAEDCESHTLSSLGLDDISDDESTSETKADSVKDKKPVKNDDKINISKLQEKLSSITKISFHKMAVKDLKKECQKLGYDVKKKKKTEMIDFLENYQKTKEHKTDFKEFLVDPEKITF